MPHTELPRKKAALVRDHKGLDPSLKGTFRLTTVDGKAIEAKPVFQLYRGLLAEYDLNTVAEITTTPQELIRRLAQDIATIKPVMIHTGEGVNPYVFLPALVTTHSSPANR